MVAHGDRERGPRSLALPATCNALRDCTQLSSAFGVPGACRLLSRAVLASVFRFLIVVLATVLAMGSAIAVRSPAASADRSNDSPASVVSGDASGSDASVLVAQAGAGGAGGAGG